MRSVSHKALDGSVVEIHTSLDLRRPFSTFVNLRLGSHLQEFGAGNREFAVANAHELGVREFNETYWFHGGTVRLGSATQADPTVKVPTALMVAAWEGERHSLYTFAYNTSDSSRLLSVLSQVRLTESPAGLTLSPTRPDATPLDGVYLLKELPPVGLLQVQPPDRTMIRRLPGWRGRQVAGGELFVGDAERHTYVLAGPTAITHVIPDPDHDAQALLPALAELRVDWKRG